MNTTDLIEKVENIMEEKPYNIEFKQNGIWTDVTITTDLIGYYTITLLKDIFKDYPIIEARNNKIAMHFMIMIK